MWGRASSLFLGLWDCYPRDDERQANSARLSYFNTWFNTWFAKDSVGTWVTDINTTPTAVGPFQLQQDHGPNIVFSSGLVLELSPWPLVTAQASQIGMGSAAACCLESQNGHRVWNSLNHRWRVPKNSVLRFCVMAIIQGKEKLISFIYSSIYFYRLVKKTLVSRLFALSAFFFVLKTF